MLKIGMSIMKLIQDFIKKHIEISIRGENHEGICLPRLFMLNLTSESISEIEGKNFIILIKKTSLGIPKNLAIGEVRKSWIF